MHPGARRDHRARRGVDPGSAPLVLGGLGTGVLVLGLLLFALGRRRRITYLTS